MAMVLFIRRRRGVWTLIALICLLHFNIAISGCGVHANPIYPITIEAQSDGTTESAVVNLAMK